MYIHFNLRIKFLDLFKSLKLYIKRSCYLMGGINSKYNIVICFSKTLELQTKRKNVLRIQMERPSNLQQGKKDSLSRSAFYARIRE